MRGATKLLSTKARGYVDVLDLIVLLALAVLSYIERGKCALM